MYGPDYSENTSKNLKTKPTPRNEFVKYVKKNSTAESNLNEELVAETIDFAGPDMKRKENIAATVADNFTKDEIRTMTENGDVLVTHGENVTSKPTVDAEHHDRPANGPAKINIDDEADATAITHEFVHHLRAEDKNRKGASKTAYDLDANGRVIKDSRTDRTRFAEECATIAETEIRSKYPTSRPNSNLGELDRQPGNTQWSSDNERKTMRSKSDAVKPGEALPRFYNKDEIVSIMPDGNNLRGKRAIDMFDRNFRRSRLGYPPKYAEANEISNVELLEEKNTKRKVHQ